MRATKLDEAKLNLSVIVVTSWHTISYKFFSRYSAKDE